VKVKCEISSSTSSLSSLQRERENKGKAVMHMYTMHTSRVTWQECYIIMLFQFSLSLTNVKELKQGKEGNEEGKAGKLVYVL
jgi:hypothetical protein